MVFLWFSYGLLEWRCYIHLAKNDRAQEFFQRQAAQAKAEETLREECRRERPGAELGWDVINTYFYTIFSGLFTSIYQLWLGVWLI